MGDENVDVVPGSRRPDGTYRKPVRVKKGYVPPEEQQTYDKFKMEKPTGVIGADVAEKGPPRETTRSKGRAMMGQALRKRLRPHLQQVAVPGEWGWALERGAEAPAVWILAISFVVWIVLLAPCAR
jgi:hypothetical protein